MRRLYLRIYFAVLASLAAFALGAAFLWHTLGEPHDGGDFALLARNVLAPAAAPAAEQQRVLEQVSRGLRLDIALFSADGKPLA
ncbi:MAG TPA: two-component sensor histidine kinase, partial [Burkholderiales bacterium]|nr:two-component sensor histidine kinase [Burkholderiales bacterium]